MYKRRAVQPGGQGDIRGAECCPGAGHTGMSCSASDYHVESLRSAGGRHWARRHTVKPAGVPHPLPARIGDQFAPDPRAARAYKEVNKVYATLTTFTGPLFHSMADGLQGLERAPGPSRR